jgi:hypothetical protein
MLDGAEALLTEASQRLNLPVGNHSARMGLAVVGCMLPC